MSKKVIIMLGLGFLAIIIGVFLLKYELTHQEPEEDPEEYPEEDPEDKPLTLINDEDETPGQSTGSDTGTGSKTE